MQQSRIEERLENLAVSFAHETTRRHALAVLSRALLAALGVSVLEPVILDRRTEAGHLCGRWNYCGMYGRPCSCCGGSDTTCPSGLTKSTSFWHRCCSGWDVWYHDLLWIWFLSGLLRLPRLRALSAQLVRQHAR